MKGMKRRRPMKLETATVAAAIITALAQITATVIQRHRHIYSANFYSSCFGRSKPTRGV